MPKHIELPDRAVRELATAIRASRPAVESAFEKFRELKSALDDPNSKLSRGLTAGDRFEEAQNARAEALRSMAKVGDIGERAELIAALTDDLDLHRLAERATWLPPIAGAADSMSHDLRVIAGRALRDDFRERISEMDGVALADEVRRTVAGGGADFSASDVLPRLHELDRQSRRIAPADPGAARARSAVIGAWGRVDEQWKGRRELVDLLDGAGRTLAVVSELHGAVRDGRDPIASRLARGIGRDLVAAGAA